MPCDLNANTDQQKGDDTQHAVSEGGQHLLRGGGCASIEHENHATEESNAAEKSQKIHQSDRETGGSWLGR